MLYEVDFLVPGACRHERPNVVETVTLNSNRVDAHFWVSTQRILKKRSSLHPTVSKWVQASACELKQRKLGLTIKVYEAARHPFTKKVERCRRVY